MALRSQSQTVNYRSISRPSAVPRTTSNSSLASLAKKQQSAEDAIYDNQYADGLISPETYVSHLNSRLSRETNTPLQKVQLEKKIGDVGEKVSDAQYDAAYSSGKITTEEYRKYQEMKLMKMTADGSQAYIQQQQKVTGLKDKQEKENRTAFRIAENKRISQMPQDTSEQAWARVAEYRRLADQARLDGDTQQADAFETQMNNAQNAAQRADVNDMITGAKLSVSQTSTPTGVPSSDSGAQIFGQYTGSKTGFSGVTSPAIKNALESLDRNKMQIDRLYQQKEDRQVMIQKYQEAIAKATGDQKTQLQITLNNLIDGDAQLDNQIQQATQNTQDIVLKIQEQQAKAAASGFSQEVRKNEQMFNKAETDLETEFSKGRITKEEYLEKGQMLAETKAQFYSQASDGFNQYGNEDKAQSYMDKVDSMDQINQSLTEAKNNPDDYEPIAIDPGGNLNNLFGKGLKPGDVGLVNVRRLKDTGLWDGNYVNDNGVWRRVQYPGSTSDVTGLPTSSAFNKELGTLDDSAFMYRGREKVPISSIETPGSDGNAVKVLMPKDQIDKLVAEKNLIEENGRYRTVTAEDRQKIADQSQGVKRILGVPVKVQDYKNAIGKIDTKQIAETAAKTGGTVFNAITKPLPNQILDAATSQQTQNFLKTATDQVGGLFGKAKNFASNAINNLLPKNSKGQATLIPQAQAYGETDGNRPPLKDDVVEQVKRALDAEGILNEKTLAYALATIDHETAGTMRPVNEGFYLDKDGRAPGTTGRQQALQRGYSGGAKYYGRGLIQLTHDYNYKAMDKRLGLNGALYNNPDLANDPEIAAKILAAFFKDHGVSDAAAQGDFVKARMGINGTDKAREIAAKAQQYMTQARDIITPQPKPEVLGPNKPTTTSLRSQMQGPINPVQGPVNQNLRSQTSGGLVAPVPQSQVINQTVTRTPTPAPKISLPQIQVPKITVPQIQLPKISLAPVQNFASNAIKSVQSVAQPVVQKVQQAASSVGNLLKNLNPFKRK